MGAAPSGRASGSRAACCVWHQANAAFACFLLLLAALDAPTPGSLYFPITFQLNLCRYGSTVIEELDPEEGSEEPGEAVAHERAEAWQEAALKMVS